MKRKILHKGTMLALAFIGLLASGIVFAEKPAWSGGGNNNSHGNDGWKSGSSGSHSDYQDNNHGNDDRSAGRNNNDNLDRYRDDNQWNRDGNDHRAERDNDGDRDHYDRDRTYSSRYFDDNTRNNVYDYYSHQIQSGHCPPGLAKKNNGCLPPGHAKQWAIGQQLPREVIFYNVEPQILAYLGPPPPRHRYVRVASDILLITIGTGMVLDAIDDLGRL